MLTQILVSIDNNELTEMIEKDHGAQITCAFCKKQYDFTEDDFKKILLTKEKNHPIPAINKKVTVYILINLYSL